jgi:hypothetical protein
MYLELKRMAESKNSRSTKNERLMNFVLVCWKGVQFGKSEYKASYIRRAEEEWAQNAETIKPHGHLCRVPCLDGW